jgi:hypothetical protein
MYVISQAMYDDFTLPLFQDLVGNRESYYMWSCPPITMDRFFQSAKFESSLICVGVKDLLDSWKEFNWWHDHQQTGSTSIQEFARRHATAQIVLFTSMENLHLEINEPNLHVIPWGGDWVNQRTEYSTLTPVLDKNFDSKKTYISLNRNVRTHRLITLSYLYGQEYDNTGVITYLKNPAGMPEVLLDIVSWEFESRHDTIRASILRGFDRLKSDTTLSTDDYEIYHQHGQRSTDNASNFENRLRNLYRDSFVEIVSESVFSSPSFMFTEKTAHAFYGCNFPIMLAGCGAVAHLRELGLDVFDDVVNHSYDSIQNPIDRVVAAVESNRTLLTNTDYAKQSWKRCQPRFEHNVAVMRDIYSWYERRARQKFAKTLELIG